MHSKTVWLSAGMAFLLLVSLAAWSEDEDIAEAEVTIVQDDKDRRVEEYRVNGQLYLVKVIPVIGPPYFLFDQDGDGQLDRQDNDPTINLPTAQWRLFKWN